LLEKFPVRLDVQSETLHVLKSPDADATRRKPLRLVLETRIQIRGSHIPFSFVVQLQFVAVWILADIGRPMSQVAIRPSDFVTGTLQRRASPLQRLLAPCAKGHMTHAGGV